jgi:glutaminase
MAESLTLRYHDSTKLIAAAGSQQFCDSQMQPDSETISGAKEANPSPLIASLQEIHAKYANNFSGKVATYIPELAKADPRLFGIALVTADGYSYEVGDASHAFTIQSISKPFVYGLALEDHGADYVLTKVGVEPTGEAFNSIVFDERHNRPFNPMVNAGAITTTALINGETAELRLDRVLKKFAALADRSLAIDHDVYLSEFRTGHRNRAIGYLELSAGMIDAQVDEHLDLYFKQCSILASARDLAVMAATLANDGVNPMSGKRALHAGYVKNVLSVMHSCGMYDYTGEWSYRIGLPAKSGVSGGVIAVLPGQFGIGIFSPLLDDQGNSCRGIQVCEELSARFKLHLFGARTTTGVSLRRTYRANTVRSIRQRGSVEQAILDRKGQAICVYELQGSLFFGALEQVFRKLAAESATLEYLILDVKRVMGIDECALTLVVQLNVWLATQDKQLIFAHLAPRFADTLKHSRDYVWTDKSFFGDTDSALEWCENRLLAREQPRAVAEILRVPLSAMNILAGFAAHETALLESIVEEVHYAQGETIIRENDRADDLFLLAAGTVSVFLRLTDGNRRRRVSTVTPGLAFGELALLDGGKRSADVIADEPALCYVLPITKLRALASDYPAIETKLIFNICRELSARLRRADAEIRSLAE